MVKRLLQLFFVLTVSNVNAIKVDNLLGLDALIEESDAIVILRVDRQLSDRYRPGVYSTYECYINQTLKGDIAKNSWYAFELMDKKKRNASPYAPGTVHVIFLKRKERQNELAKYCSLPYEEAQILVSLRSHAGITQGESIEQQIRNLISFSIGEEKRHHKQRKEFLQTMLYGPKEDRPKLCDLLDGLLEMVKKDEVEFEDCKPQYLVKIVQELYRYHDYERVIEAGKTALQMSLPVYEDATVRYYMAKCYETQREEGWGPLAKQKYQEILEMYPEYERNIEIAYRLGELNDSIIMRGTEKDYSEAINWYRYVIHHYTKYDVIYYEVLKAHMGLGNLLWDQEDYDGAQNHFETLYHTDPYLVKPLPYIYCQEDVDIDERIRWLQDRAESIQKASKEKLVNLCVRPGVPESIERLEKLQEEYAEDAELVDTAKKTITKLSQLRR